MSDGNPFAKENNPFSGDQGGQDGAFPPAMPPAMPETTKPRQMPGGDGGDTNVPQPGAEETAPDPSSVPAKAAYIRALNPHLPESVVQRLALKVVAEYQNNPLAHGMTTFEKREVNIGGKPSANVGDLNDPYNQWSPLNYDHPDYHKHVGKKPWELGDFNNPGNPNSPLHPAHALHTHYVNSGLPFGQQSTVKPKGNDGRTASLDSMVAFFSEAYANNPLDYRPTPTSVEQPVTPQTNKEHGLPTHIPGAGVAKALAPIGEAEGAGAAAAGAARIAPLLLL